MAALYHERFTPTTDDTTELRNGAKKKSTPAKVRRFGKVCGRRGAKERS